MNNEITLIIADDHPILRRGLVEVIEEEENLHVVAEASNGKDAVAAIEKFLPKIVVLDIDMPVMNGFEAARKVKAKNIATGIIFLSIHRLEEIFNEAVDIGGRGFVLKDSAATDIIDCINSVASGNFYASHPLTPFLFNRSRRAFNLAAQQPSINDLTPTEKQVLKLIAETLTSKEIGKRLYISHRTVEKHRQKICNKLDLHGSHSLFKFAVANKSKLL